ncbi:MAG TPA: hypothetical protein VMG12_01475 [Polyangiaceae bacterium]|nr:hypothetical protein [Polyangiaceae bacterium]
MLDAPEVWWHDDGSVNHGAPRNALNLAITRVVVCGVVLASSEVIDAARWAEWARALRAPVTGLAGALPLVDASEVWLGPVRLLCVVATSLALVGWRARWTAPLSALSAALLFALPHFSGGPRHSMHLVWFSLVLAVSPCALRLALPWSNERPTAAPDAAVACELSLGVLRALLAVVYFFPGFWKLAESGLDWIISDNLQNQMHWKWYEFGALPAWRIDEHPALVHLGALGVVLLELSFPLLVGWPRGRPIAAALGLGFHVAAARWMFLPFGSLLACYVVLIDWEWLLAWMADERPVDPPSRRGGLLRAVGGALRERAVGTRRVLAVAGVLLAGATLAGASGQMRAYPFACYPTFQWIAGPRLPDLWIEVEHAGERRWLADSPAHGGARPQARWGMAWRAAGVYGDAVEREHLLGYYRALPARVRGDTSQDDRLRFYRADVAVRPEAWHEPPASLVLLFETTVEGARNE